MRCPHVAFVEPGLQQRKVRIRPADIVLDGLVGLLDAPHVCTHLLGQGAEEALYLCTPGHGTEIKPVRSISLIVQRQLRTERCDVTWRRW